MLCCITGLTISVLNIIGWKKDSNNTKKQIEKIQGITSIEEVEIEEPEKFDPYYDYSNMSLINVDFKELKTINSEIIGWIQLKGTSINYPLVQTKDNEYYLNHTLDKSYNGAGWIFMDYRNNLIDDKNTIIYAHGRFDETMFGPLRLLVQSGWATDSNNFYIKMSTENENTLWRVFSVYHIPTTSDYIQTVFTDDEEFLTFVQMLKNRSILTFKTEISKEDRIITLSTCYNNKEKMVLHAKLINSQRKS